MGRGIVLALLLAAAASGCGEATSVAGSPGAPAASPTAALPAAGPVRTVTTVLDDGDGPVMCLGGMADSLPPQCDGPAVGGWDWDEHPDAESAGGSRWGEFVLVGAWDGTTFTPSEVRAATQDDYPVTDDLPFRTSCEEPAGGWVPVDPATTTGAARTRASRVAEALPDYGMTWGDQSINPRWEDAQQLMDGTFEGTSLELEQAMNDPAYTILNVGVTDDLARAEAAVREVWGGPLCVYEVANTFARLRQVAEELQDLPGGLGAQFGTISNRVELHVLHDDGSIRGWVDQEYGAGVVEVTSALQPVS